MSLRITLALCFSSASLLFGCGGATSSFEGKESTCKDFCAETVSCDKTVSASDCEETCTDTKAVSRGGQEVLTSCFAESGCDTTDLLGLADCVDDGLADLEVSGSAQKFCGETLAAISETCGEEAGTEKDCLEGIPLLSDEFLNDLNECGAKTDCINVRTCLFSAVLTNVDLGSLEKGSLGGALGGLLGSITGEMSSDVPPSTDDGTSGAAGAPGN